MTMYGLRTRHPVTGAVLSDPTTGLTRVVGSVYVPANSAGFLDVPAFSSGTPFAVGYAGGVPNIGSSQTYPVHSISGTRLSWNSAPLPTTIVYGVYAGPTAGKTGAGAAAVRFYNQNFATQIDSFYANHCVLTSGAINIPANGSLAITIAATAPLVAYRGTYLVTVLQQVKNGNGTWTLTIGAGPYGAVGTYYIFDVVSGSSQLFSTPVGLRIRNPANGAVVFDSRMKYMRVVQIADNAADGGVPASLYTTALNRDGLAAIVDPGLWFNETTRQGEDQSGNPVFTDVYSPYFVGAGVNGTTLTEGSISVGSESPVIPGNSQTGQTILVDVTNY